jgi:UDP-perosamine 4-acetyltransferase
MLACGDTVAGVLDPALQVGDQLFGVPVLGGDDHVDGLDASAILLANGLGANPDVRPRRELFTSMKRKGFDFGAVRHPAAVLGRGCELGEGALIFAGAVLQNGVRLAENTVVNTGARVDHGCRLAEHTFISPGVVLCGDVDVGASVFIGAGAIILPGVGIGSRAIVGAGAVVTKDVPEGACIAGNPAATVDRTG